MTTKYTIFRIVKVRPDGKDGHDVTICDEEQMRSIVSGFRNRDPESFNGWTMRVEKFEKVNVVFWE